MNPAIRKLLREIAYSSLKLITNVAYLFPSSDRKTPILVYHRVCPLYYKKEIPYANVYPEEFEMQMRYLKEHFSIVTVSEYLRKAQDQKLEGNEVCVTFDDGFRDNYIYAFPVLRKYGIKATFFLTTKYIGTDILFPWMPFDKGAKDDILAHRERWVPLSWEEVREMKGHGMEFGTHTHTHRDSLTKMDIHEARREIEESTRLFNERLDTTPRLFSYPHGTSKDYNDKHIEILKSCNYKAALTTNAGRNGMLQNQYELKRIIIYEEDSFWEFKKKVHDAYDIAEKLQKLWLNTVGSKPYKSWL